MRLKCPNCGAQYEVPDEVIPAEGRDVQCSNCGDTWYQTHPDRDDAADMREPSLEELHAALDDRDAPAVEDTPQPEEEQAPKLRKRDLDPDVSDILRQEAEHEAQMRAAEMDAGLESQPDLGLSEPIADEPTRRAQQVRERMARMRGEPEPAEEADEEPTPVESSRDLLPDIDELNSSLESTGDKAIVAAHGSAAESPVGGTRSGFSKGFLFALLIVLALVVIYFNAPKIAQSVPQADPLLNAYVAMIDNARIWLDKTVGGLLPR